MLYPAESIFTSGKGQNYSMYDWLFSNFLVLQFIIHKTFNVFFFSPISELQEQWKYKEMIKLITGRKWRYKLFFSSLESKYKYPTSTSGSLEKMHRWLIRCFQQFLSSSWKFLKNSNYSIRITRTSYWNWFWPNFWLQIFFFFPFKTET